MADPVTTQHDELIRSTITAAARRNGRLVEREAATAYTPLHALIDREDEEASDDWRIRHESFNDLMSFFFQKGAHPAEVLKLVYSTAKALRPDLIEKMTVRDLAKVFGDTPAAWSWRIEKSVSKRIKSAGMKGARLPFQKTDSARESFRQAQKGNKNRAGKTEAERKPLPRIPTANNIE